MTAYIIKTDANGNESWRRLFDSKNVTGLWSIQQTRDGGYVASGRKKCYECEYPLGWVLKLDVNGSTVWDKMYGNGQYNNADFIQQTADNGYIVAGTILQQGHNTSYGWLFRLNSNGNSGGFEHEYGNLNTSENVFFCVQQTRDGGYVTTGISQFDNDTALTYVMKTDFNGQELWSQTLNYKEHTNCTCAFCQQTKDGGYFVVGGVGTDRSLSAGKIWAAKLGPDTASLGLIPEKDFLTSVKDTMSNTVNQVIALVFAAIILGIGNRLLQTLRSK